MRQLLTDPAILEPKAAHSKGKEHMRTFALAIGLIGILGFPNLVAAEKRPSSAHVAVSLGDGTTVESKNSPKKALKAKPGGTRAHNPTGEDSRGLYQINIAPKANSAKSGKRTPAQKSN